MRKSELKSIVEQMKNINEKSIDVPVLVHTSDSLTKELCEQLNLMIESNQKWKADYQHSQHNYKQMLSNISHDLKTPLTVIMGLLEMVDVEKRTAEENAAFTHKASSAAQELRNMINDFFELAKLESMDTDLALCQLDLAELTRRTVLDFYDVIEHQGIGLDIDIPDYPIEVMGNQQAIERVMQNLLQNAVRYGGNQIVIEIRETSASVELAICDNGQGIDKQDLGHIFDRLFTLEDSRNKNFQGNGLGLTIVKQLMEQMKGRISASSIPYEKTEFKATFKKITY